MKLLVFNAGSSSHKSSLYEVTDQLPATAPEPLWAAEADWTKTQGKTDLKITAHGQTSEQELSTDTRTEVISQMLKTLWSGDTKVIDDLSEIAVVGHRVVHGGPEFTTSVRINQQVKDDIQKLAVFAPLHNPADLEGINTIEQIKGDIPQVAVFDTSFHRQMPLEAKVYPGPYEWYEQDIQRYGFHGISHQYCTRRSAQILGKDIGELRLVNCHLGNGCSLAAIKNGRSIDTTMGFTPLEGLMMGTRSGSIDPSILLYLEREKGYNADRLDQTLNKQSGLKGVSGISSDVRAIRKEIQAGNERANLALAIFTHRLRSAIGSMIATLGGIDVLTFTGGIGEHDSGIRASACENFSFMNLKIDQQKNNASPVDTDIATADSTVRVLVVHTQEDWEIARECWGIVKQK
ncbi:acetate/propionate family kinase [Dictyobacter aurantiacus]|uniref:Acetate kinase n=1 Tax=Dictyobacter aurantiacus TaxID=1936993 RepID=A0A401ZFC6_9CHLR|nr:acetate kinase [Dictyobacter aurantiacus]GCE05562.1 acetate kinase [Dictyobacter aurantiacus]